MKNKILILYCFLSLIFSEKIFVFYPDADLGSTEKLNSNDVETIFYLFQEGFQKYSKSNVINNKDKNICLTKECALTFSETLNANEVVRSRLRVLGNKIIFTGIILDKSKDLEFTSRVTAINVEDMENASFRLAKSLVKKDNIEDVADIDNIIEEDSIVDKRRESLYKVGFNLGYLAPFGGEGYKYWDYNQTKLRFSQTILQLGWTNYWELKDNKFVLGEAFINLANEGAEGFGAEINMSKYLSKTDFSPFYGFGIGWYLNTLITENQNINPPYDTKARHGLGFNGQIGATFLRTYNINILARLKYHAIFTAQQGNIDNGISLNIGIVYKLNPNSSLIPGRKVDKVEYRFPLLEILLGLR